MDRAYAQKIRTDRPGLAYETERKRAEYWAKVQGQVAAEEERAMEQNVAEITVQNPRQGTSFADANIEGATLDSPPPPYSPSVEPTVAGIGQGGIVPPPPPSR